MADVRQLWIPGPAGKLEARIRLASSPTAATVIVHPHPLRGGTLHNPVIFHCDRELNRDGLTTLRINLRGTGESDGTHDEGRGEVDDVAAAVSWVRGVGSHLPLLLVGFSFGALCSIRYALTDPGVRGVIALGLPVRRYPVEGLDGLASPLAVVQGSQDEFGSPAEVERALRPLGSRVTLRVLHGTSHLFPGRAREAALAVVEAAWSMLPARSGSGKGGLE